MDFRKRLSRPERRLAYFTRCRDRIKREVGVLIGEATGKTPGDVRLVQAGDGVSTLTFFVESNGNPPYVLRCLLRRREAAYLPGIYLFCERQNVSTPRLLAKRVGLWWRMKTGFHLLLEEFIPGEPIENVLAARERRQDAVHNFARSMARIHDIQGRRYGPVDGLRSGSYLGYQLKKAAAKLERIRNTVPEISAAQLRRIREFLMAERRRSRRTELFSLIHGDASNGNVLVDASDRVIFVDLEYMHFGVPEYDLEMARHYLLGDKEDLFLQFKRHYCRQRQTSAELSPSLERLCRIFVLLRSLPMVPERLGTEAWWNHWRAIGHLVDAQDFSET